MRMYKTELGPTLDFQPVASFWVNTCQTCNAKVMRSVLLLFGRCYTAGFQRFRTPRSGRGSRRNGGPQTMAANGFGVGSAE